MNNGHAMQVVAQCGVVLLLSYWLREAQGAVTVLFPDKFCLKKNY